MSTEERIRISLEFAANEVHPENRNLFLITEQATQEHNRIEVEGEVIADSLGRISPASPDRTTPYDALSPILDVRYLTGQPLDLASKGETIIVHRSTDPVFFGTLGFFAQVSGQPNDVYNTGNSAFVNASFKVAWADMVAVCGGHWQFQGALIQLTTQLTLGMVTPATPAKIFQYYISETFIVKDLVTDEPLWVVFHGDDDLPIPDIVTLNTPGSGYTFKGLTAIIWDYSAGVTDFHVHKGNVAVTITGHPPLEETRTSLLGLRTE